MTAAVVEFENIRKAYANVQALHGLSLTIPSGCIYGFLGPNGAGKSTSLRILVGILRADSGEIRVLGETDPTRIKQRIGYLPEEKGLYKKMPVLELVAYFGQLKGLSRRDARQRARTMLEAYGLGKWLKSRCEALSKGMSQKVQILSTLIHEPELVILDEPFSGLDPVNIELVRNTMLDLKKQGRSLIFSTHIMEQAEQVCDRLVLINHGAKVLEGPTGEIRRSAGRSLTIDYEGDSSILHELPGIERLNDAGQTAELTLAPGTDPQQLLQILVDKLRIRRFDTRESSLHEIFVRAVQDAPNGDADANANIEEQI